MLLASVFTFLGIILLVIGMRIPRRGVEEVNGLVVMPRASWSLFKLMRGVSRESILIEDEHRVRRPFRVSTIQMQKIREHCAAPQGKGLFQAIAKVKFRRNLWGWPINPKIEILHDGWLERRQEGRDANWRG